MNTRKTIGRALLTVLLLAVGGGAWAQVGVNGGIVQSQHDLSTGGAGQGAGGTDQVCIFCHTPHGSDTSAPTPLWNKLLQSAAGGYTRYSSLSLTSFESQETSIGSVTLACLSCHDGTQAMDTVLNLPGSGGYNAAGQNINAGTVMTGTPVPMLGTDLSNDHPVSMQYGGGGANNTDLDGLFAGTLGDPDFNPPQKATLNVTQSVWWVDSPGGTTGTREKSDMSLYTRPQVGGVGAVEPFVECGSCHDPHNSSTQGNPNTVAFLRINNTGSQICTTCHIK